MLCHVVLCSCVLTILCLAPIFCCPTLQSTSEALTSLDGRHSLVVSLTLHSYSLMSPRTCLRRSFLASTLGHLTYIIIPQAGPVQLILPVARFLNTSSPCHTIRFCSHIVRMSLFRIHRIPSAYRARPTA